MLRVLRRIGLNNGVKPKKSETKFFTVEFFGVTLIITTFLLLVCLLFGENVLFVVGREVQYFLLGLLGYASYPLLLCVNYIGFMLLFGKKIVKENKKRGTIIAVTFIILFICLLNVITSISKPESFASYVSYGFESGRKGLSGVTAGGAVFSIITYPFVNFLTQIGAILAFACFILVLLYVSLKKSNTSGVENAKEYPGSLAVEQPAPTVNGQQNAFNQNQSNVNFQQNQNPYNFNQNFAQGGNNQNFGGYMNTWGQPQNQFNQGAYNQGGYNGGNSYNQGGYQNNGAYNGNFEQQSYGNFQNNGYVNPYDGNRYGNNNYQPTPDEEERRKESMRILYGEKPRTYSEEFSNSFTDDKLRVTQNEQFSNYNINNGGSVADVSREIPKPRFNYKENDFNDNDISASELFDNGFESKINNNYNSDIDDNENYGIELDDDLEYNDEINEEPKQEEKTKSFFGSLREKEEKTSAPVKPVQQSVLPEKPKTVKYPQSIMPDLVEESASQQEQEPQVPKNIIENMPLNYKYTAPPISLFKTIDNSQNNYENEIFKNDIKGKILTTLKTFGVETTIANVFRGPAVTRFDIVVPPAMSMSRIVKLSDDLNLRIAAKSSIRMVAPVPNTSYIGIEVPNQKADSVSLKDILSSDGFINTPPFSLYFAFGKDIIGNPVSLNLADMPHVLISGTTGSGKSVCLNSMILSMISKYGPDQLRFVIVDPKQVDFEPFRDLPHMMFNTIIDNDLALCNSMLTWAVEEMERRYAQLKTFRSKNIGDYNRRAVQNKERIMPRIVIIIDEFADLMMRDKKGIGEKICLLAQKSRAAGIHLVLAAQRPSADVVNGPIKANLPARLVFRASSHIDSTVSLGETGAEKLLGKGDCLYKTGGMLNTERAMGAYVSDDELYDIIDYVVNHNTAYYDYNAWTKIKSRVEAASDDSGASFESSSSGGVREGKSSGGVDQLYINAMRVGFDYDGISISSLQRRLGLGYPKAAKVVDWLVDNGYLSAESSHGKKKLLITKEEYEEKFCGGASDDDSQAE